MQSLLSDSSYTMTTVSEELDKTGKIESTTETVMRVTKRAGRSENVLLRATRDGRDITEEEKKRVAERKAKEAGSGSKTRRSMTISASSPFEPAAQGKHRFALAPGASDPQSLRVRFELKGKKTPEVSVGEAVIDPEAGTVLKIRYRPAENPPLVSRMEIEMDYATPTPAGPALSRLSIDAAGGVLFIKKRVRATTRFFDYTFPEKSAASPPNP